MSQEIDNGQKYKYLAAVLGLGLILSAVWALILVIFPPGAILTVVNISLYVVSLTIIGSPTYAVLKMFTRTLYAVIFAVIIWAVWVFGVKELFVILIRLVWTR